MSDTVDIRSVDFVELWVGNARQAASFFSHTFGFAPLAVAGPETGVTDRVSYLLTQGDVRFIVTGPTCRDSEVAKFVFSHGDGIRDIAFEVGSIDSAYATTAAGGGRVSPVHDEDRGLARFELQAVGDTVHTLVERSDDDWFLPEFASFDGDRAYAGVGLSSVDHVAISVERGSRCDWVGFYERALRFSAWGDIRIDAADSSFTLTTVSDDSRTALLPIAEPGNGRKRSQIQEFIDHNGSGGAHHIAFQTDDIVATIRRLRERNVKFLTVPDTYYEAARERLQDWDLPWADLLELGILVDGNESGYLMQTFTETVSDRPTLYMEVIQRSGAEGFGEANIRALYEAVSIDQARRGN